MISPGARYEFSGQSPINNGVVGVSLTTGLQALSLRDICNPQARLADLGGKNIVLSLGIKQVSILSLLGH